MTQGFYGFGNAMLNDFDRLQREMESLFNLGLGQSGIRAGAETGFPQIFLTETKDEVYVYAFAPGLKTESIDLTIQGNLLSFSAERVNPFEVKLREKSESRIIRHRKESFQGKFSRMITLPETIDPNQVEAHYEAGVFTVRLGKKSEMKPRKIDVKSLN